MQTNFFTTLGSYFPLLLLIVTLVTGIIAAFDKYFFEKHRVQALLKQGVKLEALSKKDREEKLKGPLVADYARSLFPVFLFVFALRSFVAEPFKIPSGSMLPTLKVGDYLVVTKYDYGLRFPVWDKQIIPVGKPQLGDVAIFHYPVDTKVDFIKRIVGVPGDRVSYQNKQLSINGVKVPKKFIGKVLVPADSTTRKVNEYQETIGLHTFNIIQMPWRPSPSFKSLVIPKGEYLAMGDNRDNSDDSRYWGLVPFSYFVGKPKMVVFSWNGRTGHGRWDRIGTRINK